MDLDSECNRTSRAGVKDNDWVRLVFEQSPLAAGVDGGQGVGMGELKGRETKEEANVIVRAGDCEAQAGAVTLARAGRKATDARSAEGA